MKYIKFPKDNKIIYGQDFACWAGVPHDLEFEITEIADDKIWFKGPGHGGVPYGNGPICVYLKTDTRFQKGEEN
jgi:diadenosine tetraphosphatase ApaH/serine/threonine PP2A family protein phosphatase